MIISVHVFFLVFLTALDLTRYEFCENSQSTMSQDDRGGDQRRNPSTSAAYPMANSNIQGRQFDRSQAGEFRPPPFNYPAKFGLPAQSTMSRNDHAGGQGRNPSTPAAYSMANSNIQGRQFDRSPADFRPQPVHFPAKFGLPSLHTMGQAVSAGGPGRNLSASDAEPFRPPQPMHFSTKLRLNYHPTGWIRSPVVSRKRPFTLSGFPTDQNAK